jgi:hypothetical protein
MPSQTLALSVKATDSACKSNSIYRLWIMYFSHLQFFIMGRRYFQTESLLCRLNKATKNWSFYYSGSRLSPKALHSTRYNPNEVDSILFRSKGAFCCVSVGCIVCKERLIILSCHIFHPFWMTFTAIVTFILGYQFRFSCSSILLILRQIRFWGEQPTSSILQTCNVFSQKLNDFCSKRWEC